MTSTLERRKLEMFFAMLTTGFGAWLLFPAEAMDAPALVHVRGMADELAWGGLFLSNGMMHCTWLAVNGARRRSSSLNRPTQSSRLTVWTPCASAATGWQSIWPK